MATVNDVLRALDYLTEGRVLGSQSRNFIVWKNSGIKGKNILEKPGLVFGESDRVINKLAVTMTMSEHDIELAAATGVDAIVAHHPVADATSSGGVTLKNYLTLYGLAVFELHEAFHGLHPGIPFLHGHQAYYSNLNYGGKEGNVLFAGTTLPEVKNLGDVLQRLSSFMDLTQQVQAERDIQGNTSIDTITVKQGEILLGNKNSEVKNVLHIFPHTGFSVDDLQHAFMEFPESDTVIASISRVQADSPLVKESNKLGLNFVIGNNHISEIFENGLPLAFALDKLLPKVEVVVFRERVTSYPVKQAGGEQLTTYAEKMASDYLLSKVRV
ncbi:NIF3 (NGG1p interacting factor 3) protein [Melghirimyces profundicolus]|uniref:GTP cyclohydrolase 1 type 2 homolog n=1 Tax=Melghirimyces profundicolus TaxID=1242148 RepID=A0A2T6C8R0_9BACL|nr:Nif3-like dinuclear metal center hexameric protein [Melghirimyces profundicolus]PTX64656.1 NIF3 (NGG1p interacting factor 3) protein [Melghirimyces profundicolus]